MLMVSVKEIEADFEDYKEYEANIFYRAEDKNKNVSNADVKANQQLELNTFKFAADIHVQFRIKAEVYIQALTRAGKNELRVKLGGFDVSFCNPTGPITVRLSLLIKQIALDVYYHCEETEDQFERKKRSIFDKEIGTIRNAMKTQKDSEHNLATRKRMYSTQLIKAQKANI